MLKVEFHIYINLWKIAVQVPKEERKKTAVDFRNITLATFSVEL